MITVAVYCIFCWAYGYYQNKAGLTLNEIEFEFADEYCGVEFSIHKKFNVTVITMPIVLPILIYSRLKNQDLLI